MNQPIIFILLLLMTTLVNCSEPPSKPVQENTHENAWKEVKTKGSPEAFARYLIENPHSENIPAVIDSCRSYWNRNNITQAGLKLAARNVISILINKEGRILLDDGEEVGLTQMKSKIIALYFNRENNLKHPEQDSIDAYQVSKAVFLVNFSQPHSPSPEILGSFFSEMKDTFQEIKEKKSIMAFHKEMEALNSEELELLKSLAPLEVKIEVPPGLPGIPKQ